MSESTTPDKIFDNIVDLVREAQRNGRSLLISSAEEIADGGLSIRHGRANLTKYGMAMAMLADMAMLVSDGTDKPMETVITDTIRAIEGIKEVQDSQAAELN